MHACGLQARDDGSPVGSVGEGAVHQHDAGCGGALGGPGTEGGGERQSGQRAMEETSDVHAWIRSCELRSEASESRPGIVGRAIPLGIRRECSRVLHRLSNSPAAVLCLPMDSALLLGAMGAEAKAFYSDRLNEIDSLSP
jgi:hypothetical protein